MKGGSPGPPRWSPENVPGQRARKPPPAPGCLPGPLRGKSSALAASFLSPRGTHKKAPRQKETLRKEASPKFLCV